MYSVFDKTIMSDRKFQDSSYCYIEHWPVQVESGKFISRKIFWQTTGVKVNSSVCRCDSCQVSFYIHHFNIYNKSPDLVTIKKKINRETPKLAEKGNEVKKHCQACRM